MILVPYTVGNKFNETDDLGSIGYIKCNQCGKIANFRLKKGTLQNKMDGVIPLGRKHETYMIQCRNCNSNYIPKEEKLDQMIELTKNYPASFDHEMIEKEIDKLYKNKTEIYLTGEQAITQFPILCEEKLASKKSKAFQNAVKEAAVAYIYNIEWPKTIAGKKEERAIKTKTTLKTAWIIFLFGIFLITLLATLASRQGR